MFNFKIANYPFMVNRTTFGLKLELKYLTQLGLQPQIDWDTFIVYIFLTEKQK